MENLHPGLTTSLSKFRERTKAGAPCHTFLPFDVALYRTFTELDARTLCVGVEVHQVLPLDM